MILPFDQYLTALSAPISCFRKTLILNDHPIYLSRESVQTKEKYVPLLFEACKTVGITYCPVQFSIWISYSDFYGDLTKRRVDVRSLFCFNRIIYIDGYCLLRRQFRTFKLHRIEAAMFRGNEYVGSNIEQLTADIITHAGHDPRNFDFFCHPDYFSNGRKAAVALRLWGIGNGHSDDEIFSVLFKFFAESSLRSSWAEWFQNGQAIAAAGLSECIAFTPSVPKISDTALVGRHISKPAFWFAVDSLR